MRHTKYILLLSVVYLLQSHLPIHSQSALLETLSAYEVIDFNSLITQEKKSLTQFQHLDLGKYGKYTLDIYENELISDKYKAKISTADGVIVKSSTLARSYIGKVKGASQSSVALTINDDFIHGFIKLDGKEINIEPLRYYQINAQQNEIVVYESADQEHKHTVYCGLDHKLEQEFKESLEQQKVNKSFIEGCIEVDMAIASDYLMYEHYGSVENVENHAIAMLNAAQTNYDTEFDNEIRFNLVEQFISECATCDPWTSSTDTETLLKDFRQWSSQSWENTIDQSSLWSKRDFERNGNTSANGLAFVNTICTNHSSLIVEDNDTANRKRVLFSHELGHNFGAVHDEVNSNFIMSTPLVETNEWSPASKEDINNRYLKFTCLTGCERSQNVVADFDVEFIGACVPVNVQFRNKSIGDLDSVKWTFPGGNPTYSTQLEPIVNYGVGGSFDVRLEIFGANGTVDVLERSDVIKFGQTPTSDFTFTLVDKTRVSFTVDRPFENTDYSWEFGDGFTSSDQNPIHNYQTLDSMLVTLTTSNTCGTSSYSAIITTETTQAPRADFTSTKRLACIGESIQFTNLSENADSVSWFFEGATPFNTSEQNPVINYENLGSFAVGLIAINASGADTILVSSYTLIDPLPISAFIYDVDGKTVSFAQQSQYARTLTWDFGDGNVSEDINATHTYATAGNYTVSLLVENFCQSVTSSQTIQVEANTPLPDFTPSSTELCQNGSVLFRNNSTNANQYQWEFEGGIPASSTDESPIIAYMVPGSYSVKLMASNDDGSTELIKEELILVNPEPVVDFDFSVNGGFVEFINNSQHLSSAQWSFGDGTTSTSNNVSHSYKESGSYEVSLLGVNSCGFATGAKTVTIDIELPTASFDANNNTICAGSVVSFVSSAQNSSSVKWIFEGGIPETSTSERPSVLYIAKGDYNVTQIATNQNGSDTLLYENYVTATMLPVAAFESELDGLAVSLLNQSVDEDEYFWNLGDGSFSTDENPNHTYTENGDYTILLRVTNGCGSAEMSTVVSVMDTLAETNNIDQAQLDFSISADEICRGNEVLLTNLSTGIDSVMWYLNDTIAIQAGSLTLSELGINRVSLIGFVNGKSERIEKDIFVQGVPEPNFSFQRIGDTNEIKFINSSQSADNYIWSFGDRFSSAFESPNHLFEQDLPYTVELTASNSCSSARLQKVVDLRIKEKPKALFSMSTNNAICRGQSVTFDALDTLATDFKWVFEGTRLQESDLPKVTTQYANLGNYDVQFIASNFNGSDTSYLQNFITVSDSPDVELNITQEGEQVNFVATEIIGAAYSWNFGDGTSSSEVRPSHTYSEEGEYKITLAVDLSCGRIVLTDTVLVEQNNILPKASFSITNKKVNVGGRIRFSSLSTNTTSVKWYFEGGSVETSEKESIIIQYDQPGVFDVILIASNEYGVDTVYKEDFITVESLGIQTAETRELSLEKDDKLQVNFHPNPFIDELNVTIETTEIGTGELYLYNSAGVLVHKESFSVSDDRYKLSIGQLDMLGGMYVARIIIGEQFIQQKIIKL